MNLQYDYENNKNIKRFINMFLVVIILLILVFIVFSLLSFQRVMLVDLKMFCQTILVPLFLVFIIICIVVYIINSITIKKIIMRSKEVKDYKVE